MKTDTLRTHASSLFRIVKVALAAWALGVAGVIICIVVLMPYAGTPAETWFAENMLVVNFVLFLLGLPLAYRWVK